MLIILLVLLGLLTPTLTQAATISLPTLDYTTVQNTVTNAAAGDIIILSAGTTTWSSALAISKPITLQGAGIGKTTIIGTAGVVFTLTASSTTQLTRLTGFTINGNQQSVGVNVYNANGIVYGHVRIDNCDISQCTMEGIKINGIMAALIDHCNIHNNYLQIGNYPVAQQDLSWQLPLSLGTINNTITEDCTFGYDKGGFMPFQGSFENGQGARLVFRYNKTTNAANLNMTPFFDAHGNQGLVDTVKNVSVNGAVRATRSLEMYENTIDNGTAGDKMTYYRGGVLITFNNTFKGGFKTGWQCNEEDGNSRWNLRTAYPGYDQHWMWSWGNTLNGNPINSWYSGHILDPGPCPGTTCNDSLFLVTGLNVFWERPSATAPGYPVASNPITSYTPLVHPHPWITASAPMPNAPQHLRAL